MYAFYIQNLFKVPYVIQKNISKHLNNFPHLESHQSSPHFDIYICIYYKLVFESLLKHKTEQLKIHSHQSESIIPKKLFEHDI